MWTCEHRHTKEEHPECWRNHLALKTVNARLDMYPNNFEGKTKDLLFALSYGGEKKTNEQKQKIKKTFPGVDILEEEDQQEPKKEKWSNIGYMALSRSGKMLKIAINKNEVWTNYYVFADSVDQLLHGDTDKIWIKKPPEETN